MTELIPVITVYFGDDLGESSCRWRATGVVGNGFTSDSPRKIPPVSLPGRSEWVNTQSGRCKGRSRRPAQLLLAVVPSLPIALPHLSDFSLQIHEYERNSILRLINFSLQAFVPNLFKTVKCEVQ
jgi:hypothetical protein